MISKLYSISLQVACTLVAVLLHYFLLVSFAWMLVEGVHLYVMVVTVFENSKEQLRIYGLCAYGLPGIVVLIAASVAHDGYGTDSRCWLSVTNGVIYAFVGPALAVILVSENVCRSCADGVVGHFYNNNNNNNNSIPIATEAIERPETYHRINDNFNSICIHYITSYIHYIYTYIIAKSNSKVIHGSKIRFDYSEGGICTLCSVQKSLEMPHPHSNEPDHLLFHIIRSGVKSATVLFPLLGITWLFGILALDTKTIVFQYFFAILNSLQGFFIFIFHCLLNSEVRKAMQRKKEIWSSRRTFFTPSSTIPSSAAAATTSHGATLSDVNMISHSDGPTNSQRAVDGDNIECSPVSEKNAPHESDKQADVNPSGTCPTAREHLQLVSRGLLEPGDRV
ncbi:adhesion G-protein coupled receptor D1-like [Orbicella faveolata]|uniref:adhesion G-protein coupled receptor D1-like n=1 Tax=Orbicella faveolata TaxID=48498 RepID=UPI0009E5233E|nr:adhesion G-protein coupled receptor D1-like [Orbicella faveolata]